MTNPSNRYPRAFDRSGPSLVVTRDISKTFGRIWHAVLLYKLRSNGKYARYWELLRFFSNIALSGYGWGVLAIISS